MFYNLYRNIKYLRKQNKLTIVELAHELNLATSSLANFEGGQRNCSLEILDKLSKFFNVSLDDLVYKDLKNNY
mgnify:CR=1 FL=1